MKIIVLLGLVIVFISSLFILLIFNFLIKSQVSCVKNLEKMKCDVKSMSMEFVIGLVIIGFFVLVDFGTIYIMTTSWTAYWKG